MPSTNHRSSSTRPSRPIQTIIEHRPNRSTSVPARQFIIIITNNPELVRQTRIFHPQLPRNTQTRAIGQNSGTNNNTSRNTTNTNTNTTTTNSNNDRELVLNDLLRVELREAAQDYLRRTRRPYPIHYVFDMSDIDTQNPTS